MRKENPPIRPQETRWRSQEDYQHTTAVRKPPLCSVCPSVRVLLAPGIPALLRTLLPSFLSLSLSLLSSNPPFEPETFCQSCFVSKAVRVFLLRRVLIVILFACVY
ncbi:hypothetical protein CEXT_684811 [Caerostris extrusa]|uniref:Uncharacterized protein n=1 Tax=Caerostris extrusa TaxID=172846 RepID=A0AAV4NZK5_CAEEX|nr:hypothetical protein CEXT_684811 [Caerostris extrusa]